MSLDLRNYSGADPAEWNPSNLLQAALDVTEVKDDPRVIMRDSMPTPASKSGTDASGLIQAANEFASSELPQVNNLTTSFPLDVSKISEIHVLGRTNETLLIGWKRPAVESGSFIKQYQMQLRDSKGNLISEQSMEMDPGGKVRNNYMYIFVNLSPASEYSFGIRPCSVSGCANWTEGMGRTQDGWADPPQDVRVSCFQEDNGVWLSARWDPPGDAKGTVVGFNITLSGHSTYRNEANESQLDHFSEWYEVKGNSSLEFKGQIRWNTNYTTRICAMNKAGCGSLSYITSKTMCESPSQVPDVSVDASSFSLANPEDKSCRKLKAQIRRVSERNGLIKCYKLVIIRLPQYKANNSIGALLPKSPRLVNISNYWDVHSDLINSDQDPAGDGLFGAYVADEIPSLNLGTEVSSIVGDSDFSSCYSDREEVRLPRRVKQQQTLSPFSSPSPYLLPYDTRPQFSQHPTPSTSTPSSPYDFAFNNNADTSGDSSHLTGHTFRGPLYRPYRRGPYDGALAPGTNYTGFIQIEVTRADGSVLTKESEYFSPVMTGAMEEYQNMEMPFAPILSSMSDSANAIAFGVVTGLALVFLLLVFVLCFLTRKVSEGSEADPEQSPAVSQENIGGFDSVDSLNDKSCRTNGHIPRTDPENFSDKWICQPVCIQDLPPLTFNVMDGTVVDSDLVFPLDSVPEQFTGDLNASHDLTQDISPTAAPCSLMSPPVIIQSTFQTIESPETPDETRYADVHL